MTLIAVGSIPLYSWSSSWLTVCSIESPSWNSYSRTLWLTKSKISPSTLLSHSRTQTVPHMHFGHSLTLIRTSFQTRCFGWTTISSLSTIKASKVKNKTYSQSVIINGLFILNECFIILCTCLSSHTKSILSLISSVSHCLVKYNYYVYLIISMNSSLIYQRISPHSNPTTNSLPNITSASYSLSYFYYLSYFYPNKLYPTLARPISV